MKRLILFSLIAVVAVVLAGCATSGHGNVQLFGGTAGGTPLVVPSEATFSFSFACYAQNNNQVEGYLNWNDPTNGVRFSATLPETPVKELGMTSATTCKELKAAMATSPFYAGGAAYIYDQNEEIPTGSAMIMVDAPTESGLCGAPGEPGTGIVVYALDEQRGTMYVAYGCLDRGKIVLGPGQNQQ